MKKKYIINNFNRLNVFDIDINKLRSKNFYRNAISNRNQFYKQYNKYLNKKQNICHLCKNKKSELFLSFKKYQLRRCFKCGVIFSNINTEKFKESNFYNQKRVLKDFKEEMIKTFNYRKKNFGLERLKYIKQKIPINKNFKVLDFGCGSGYFISVLKENKIKNKGIDLDKSRIDFCKYKKLNAECSDIYDEKNNSYDLITMFDAIEHFYDPISTLKLAARKLKSKGHILAYTPNINSLSFELLRSDLNLLAVFRHLCFFNDLSLKYLCKKTNLKIKSIEYYGLDIKDYFQAIEYKEKIELNDKLKKFTNLTQAIIDKQKLSNSMRIIFQKV